MTSDRVRVMWTAALSCRSRSLSSSLCWGKISGVLVKDFLRDFSAVIFQPVRQAAHDSGLSHESSPAICNINNAALARKVQLHSCTTCYFPSRKKCTFFNYQSISSSRGVEMCRKNNRSLRNILSASRENPLGGHHKSNRVAASERLIPIIQDLPKQLLTKILLFFRLLPIFHSCPYERKKKSCRRAAIEPTIFITAYSTLTLFGWSRFLGSNYIIESFPSHERSCWNETESACAVFLTKKNMWLKTGFPLSVDVFWDVSHFFQPQQPRRSSCGPEHDDESLHSILALKSLSMSFANLNFAVICSMTQYLLDKNIACVKMS